MAAPALRDLGPWLPAEPGDLARLAWLSADAAGAASVRAWPEWSRGGLVFGGLPPFLPWRGTLAGRWHLALFQARELGALAPGARIAPLPESWLEQLDLESLARPLAIHPDLPGGAAVHVVRVAGPGQARVRSWGLPGPELVGAALARLTGEARWRVELA